ncbi:CDGSH iron-sulfur domain-containing protein 3, mitochondrial [Belonocnema kinseyi]|uniref:CDGSH iron-sulfur domain-containing protein 3, mitochondrial n=1 Tax=Belonocnema kinseyi TaxID=2817044 RepID=UPI00143CCD1B|nr:CDGSH iron-sulfur domain-containing protein 3, mitochondrial [Belonocnema kinseyi]
MNLTSVINKLQRLNQLALWKQRYIARYSTKTEEPEIPKNPLKEVFSANMQKGNGVIYDKKPFRMNLVAGKNYSWCLCGQSKNQPLCDGTHKNIFLKVKLRPIRFTVPETKEYWLCNCKQTSNRPFCDGTHLREDIQALKR